MHPVATFVSYEKNERMRECLWTGDRTRKNVLTCHFTLVCGGNKIIHIIFIENNFDKIWTDRRQRVGI